MKNEIRVTSLLVAFLCLLFSSGAMAQKTVPTATKTTTTEPVYASISDDLVITLPETPGELSAVYLIDIKNLPFKSEEVLNKFCSTFSMDFHVLRGDFKQQQITLELDRQAIERKGFSRVQVNAYFADFSPRMVYFFNNANK